MARLTRSKPEHNSKRINENLPWKSFREGFLYGVIILVIAVLISKVLSHQKPVEAGQTYYKRHNSDPFNKYQHMLKDILEVRGEWIKYELTMPTGDGTVKTETLAEFRSEGWILLEEK